MVNNEEIPKELEDLILSLKKTGSQEIKTKILESNLYLKITLGEYIEEKVKEAIRTTNYTYDEDYSTRLDPGPGSELEKSLSVEAKAKILNKLEKKFTFKRKKGLYALENYMKKIARGVVINRLEKKIRKKEKKEKYEHIPRNSENIDTNTIDYKATQNRYYTTTGDIVCKMEMEERLFNKLESLESEKQKHTVQLYYYEGFSQPEIADKFGISQQAIHSRLERALSNLKKMTA